MKIWSGNKNMEAYHQMEQELLAKYHGKTAVFCEGKLVAIGDDIEDAIEKASASVPKEKEIFVKNLYTAKEQTQAILVLVL